MIEQDAFKMILALADDLDQASNTKASGEQHPDNDDLMRSAHGIVADQPTLPHDILCVLGETYGGIRWGGDLDVLAQELREAIEAYE